MADAVTPTQPMAPQAPVSAPAAAPKKAAGLLGGLKAKWATRVEANKAKGTAKVANVQQALGGADAK